jgi:hypothetical protein
VALVGYWPLNDGSGTTGADASGNGHNLTLTAPDWANPARLGCDGSTTYGETASVATFNLPTFTFACRVVLDVVASTNHFFIELFDGANQPAYMWFTSNNQYGLGTNVLVGGFHKSGGGFEDRTFSWTPSAATVYHLALTWDGTDMKAYVDGSQVGTTQTPGTTPAAGTSLVSVARQASVGATPAYMDGQIWDVRVYDVALTAGEVASLAANAAGSPWYYYAQQQG